jgi:hypothetical protein
MASAPRVSTPIILVSGLIVRIAVATPAMNRPPPMLT